MEMVPLVVSPGTLFLFCVTTCTTFHSHCSVWWQAAKHLSQWSCHELGSSGFGSLYCS